MNIGQQEFVITNILLIPAMRKILYGGHTRHANMHMHISMNNWKLLPKNRSNGWGKGI